MSIRFAVVGAGHIGKRHIEMISRQPGAELAAIADLKSRAELGLQEDSIPFYQSLDELLSGGPEFDVLSIATPNGVHHTHAIKALNAGKHVVIEKPMALSKEQCEDIIATAEKQQKTVFCVMQNRYSPPARWMKTLVDEGILGDIYMVQINCFWNRDDRYYKPGHWKGSADLDGGTLFTQFSHFIDLLYWLFGDITDFKSSFDNFNHAHSIAFEDSGMVLFRIARGGMGSISYSTALWDKNFESSVTIIAEKGTIKIGGQYVNEVQYCHIRDYDMPALPESNPANDYGHYKGSAANHNYIFDNVVRTLTSGGSPDINADEGLKVVDIIEQIYRANPYIKKTLAG